MDRIIECVPNFSEGRDPAVIRQITDQIEAVEGVKLLHVDPGKATNRTVVTFAGTPEAVLEAAFRVIQTAAGEIRPTFTGDVPADARRLSAGADRWGHHGGGGAMRRAAGPAGRRGAGDSGLPLRGGPAQCRAQESGDHPRRGVRGLLPEDQAGWLGAGLRTAGDESESGRYSHRGSRLPGGLQRQPQHHLHPARQRRGLRRA